MKKVFGVGINDLEKSKGCPFYSRWHGMLKRCYYTKSNPPMPTYLNVSVCDEWLIFSNFKSWMETQDWEGKELDKDLLLNGNKIYSPMYCRFISHELNSLLVNCSKGERTLPLGVSRNKKSNTYFARTRVNNISEYLGSYQNPLDAHLAWNRRKKEAILDHVALQKDEKIVASLLERVLLLDQAFEAKQEIINL